MTQCNKGNTYTWLLPVPTGRILQNQKSLAHTLITFARKNYFKNYIRKYWCVQNTKIVMYGSLVYNKSNKKITKNIFKKKTDA